MAEYKGGETVCGVQGAGEVWAGDEEQKVVKPLDAALMLLNEGLVNEAGWKGPVGLVDLRLDEGVVEVLLKGDEEETD